MTVYLRKALREAFGETLVELGEQIPEIVVLDADISASLKTNTFAKRYPERHINCGVAEQNMMMNAAGLATTGLIPLACTYATFSSMRTCEQIRSFICYANLNVKIISTHGGIEVGWDGPTHQATEDVAMMRAIPNMTVVAPADAVATSALLRRVVAYAGPTYFRMGRNPVPVIYKPNQEFTIGKAIKLREGADVTLVAMGAMVSVGLDAVEKLAAENIQAGLLDMHTVKPLDGEALLAAARNTHAIVTLEDHNIIGGLGGAVAEFLAEHKPVPVVRVGVPDTFAESGAPHELFEKYGMSANHVVDAAHRVLK
ncbi:MAG: transketolase [Anaerolineaceae bacterium 4572_5.2]|nr:MAG: transketolase [Anaerolineaceae bacterium 4572_5.2]